LTYAPVETLERLATEFNQPPYALNVFPIGMKRAEKLDCVLKVDNVNVVLSCLKKADRGDGYVLRLFNNDSRETKTTLRFEEGEAELKFGAYEVKTVLYCNGAKEYSTAVKIGYGQKIISRNSPCRRRTRYPLRILNEPKFYLVRNAIMARILRVLLILVLLPNRNLSLY
jgi:hypothetical protein